MRPRLKTLLLLIPLVVLACALAVAGEDAEPGEEKNAGQKEIAYPEKQLACSAPGRPGRYGLPFPDGSLGKYGIPSTLIIGSDLYHTAEVSGEVVLFKNRKKVAAYDDIHSIWPVGNSVFVVTKRDDNGWQRVYSGKEEILRLRSSILSIIPGDKGKYAVIYEGVPTPWNREPLGIYAYFEGKDIRFSNRFSAQLFTLIANGNLVYVEKSGSGNSSSMYVNGAEVKENVLMVFKVGEKLYLLEITEKGETIRGYDGEVVAKYEDIVWTGTINGQLGYCGKAGDEYRVFRGKTLIATSNERVVCVYSARDSDVFAVVKEVEREIKEGQNDPAGLPLFAKIGLVLEFEGKPPGVFESVGGVRFHEGKIYFSVVRDDGFMWVYRDSSPLIKHSNVSECTVFDGSYWHIGIALVSVDDCSEEDKKLYDVHVWRDGKNKYPQIAYYFLCKDGKPVRKAARIGNLNVLDKKLCYFYQETKDTPLMLHFDGKDCPLTEEESDGRLSKTSDAEDLIRMLVLAARDFESDWHAFPSDKNPSMLRNTQYLAFWLCNRFDEFFVNPHMKFRKSNIWAKFVPSRGPYIEIQEIEKYGKVVDTGTLGFKKHKYQYFKIYDAWGTELIFRCPGLDWSKANPDWKDNSGSFDIYSAGPDGMWSETRPDADINLDNIGNFNLSR